jgi:hypothetical protein
LAFLAVLAPSPLAAHELELTENTARVVKEVAALRPREAAADPSPALEKGLALLRTIPPGDVHHLGLGLVRWNLPGQEDRNWVSLVARTLRVARAWGDRLGIPVKQLAAVIRDDPAGLDEMFLQLADRLGHKYLFSALEAMSESEQATVRCLAGKVICLAAHFLPPGDQEAERWVVTRLRALLRDADPRVAGALPMWVVETRLPAALKPLAELATDSRSSGDVTSGVMARTARTLSRAVINAIEGHFGLADRGFAKRFTDTSPSAVRTWIESAARDPNLYVLRPEWVPTIELAREFVVGEPVVVPTSLGSAKVTFVSRAIVPGPRLRVAYRVEVQLEKIGYVTTEDQHCLLGTSSGSESTGPGEYTWRVLVVPAPRLDGKRLWARLSIWRKAGG